MSESARLTAEDRRLGASLPDNCLASHDLPVCFFFNTEVASGMSLLRPQVEKARDTGVHLYSFVLPWPWEGEAENYSEGESLLALFAEVDPDARFLLRLRCEGSPAWLAAHPDECVQYADGHRAAMSSLGSDTWMRSLGAGLRHLLRYYETGPFAERIVAYHPCSQNSNEWFHHEYYLHGPDISEVNRQAFICWLRQKYQSLEKLVGAWGRKLSTWQDATIELAALALGDDDQWSLMLDPSHEQAVIDFQEFSSRIVARRIAEVAHIVKDESARRKKVVCFYGYILEMLGIGAGHHALGDVLACKDVDILASPLSYHDRQPGNVGSFMAPVDSVPLHGKMWYVENDYRTDCLDDTHLPSWMTHEGLGPKTRDRAETMAVVQREFGSMLVHRAGTWWMDLIAGGAWNDTAVWDMIGGELLPLLAESTAERSSYVPDVAIIVDEESVHRLRFPIGAKGAPLTNPVNDGLCRFGREALARAGASLGWYLLSDYLAHRTPPCRLTCFLNIHDLADEREQLLATRVADGQGSYLWFHAPFAFDGSAARLRRLTGLPVQQGSGTLGSEGIHQLTGLSWGEARVSSPRYHLDSSVDIPLAVYRVDGRISCGGMRFGEARQWLHGDIQMDWRVIGEIFDQSGVHRWTRDGSVVQTDGRLLFVHSANPTFPEVQAPKGRSLEQLFSEGRTASCGPVTRVYRIRQ